MKNLNFPLLVCFVFPFANSYAQATFKIGPTFMAAYYEWEERVSPAAGLEVSYEYGFLDKFSASIAGMAMYGHNRLRDKQEQRYVQHDYHVGMQTELRWHLNELYNDTYIGLGADFRFLTAINFFPPGPNPGDGGDLENWEMTTGISVGKNIKTKENRLINPYVYLGVDSRIITGSGFNEYPVLARFGVNFGFQ